jgi:hypothetical protein
MGSGTNVGNSQQQKSTLFLDLFRYHSSSGADFTTLFTTSPTAAKKRTLAKSNCAGSRNASSVGGASP